MDSSTESRVSKPNPAVAEMLLGIFTILSSISLLVLVLLERSHANAPGAAVTELTWHFQRLGHNRDYCSTLSCLGTCGVQELNSKI